MATELTSGAGSAVNQPPTAPTQAPDVGTTRRDLKTVSKLVQDYDHGDRRARLAEAASLLGKRDPHELLEDVANDWGLSWNTVATMLGVSATALRKWRRGGSITPENRGQIALLTAFLSMLERIKEPIADVGSWIEMRVHEDSTLTPALLYASGPQGRSLVLDWAGELCSVTEMLDQFDAEWRRTHARDPSFRVVSEGPGGERAIVPR